MTSIDPYFDGLLARGRAYFSQDQIGAVLGLKPSALAAAITRAINKRQLANPRHGFYLILRPEDQVGGAPDPVKWIDPLMKHQGIDYRVSPLRAAAFHGAPHQTSVDFQVVVPKQLRDFDPSRHRLQFLYQGQDAFRPANQASLVDQVKSYASFATVAVVELAVLDCVRYLLLQGSWHQRRRTDRQGYWRKGQPASAAEGGRLLRELGGPPAWLPARSGGTRAPGRRAARVRETCQEALPLDPAVRPLVKVLAQAGERNPGWRLLINEAVEIAE